MESETGLVSPLRPDDERRRLLENIVASLEDVPVQELRNVWRMVQKRCLAPQNAYTNNSIGHYPAPETELVMNEAMDACFLRQWESLLKEMPDLVRSRCGVEFDRCLTLCRNTAMVAPEVTDATRSKLRGFLGSTVVEESHLCAWQLFGEYCKMSTMVAFMETLANLDGRSETQDVQVFHTVDMVHASGILQDATSSLMRADHKDWTRMKGCQGLRVQGCPVLGDVQVQP